MAHLQTDEVSALSIAFRQCCYTQWHQRGFVSVPQHSSGAPQPSVLYPAVRPKSSRTVRNAPGEYTAELLGEDAAAIIRYVFKGESVHILGWSLGGALGYYLAIEHPDIVASVTVSGMSSCFGRPLLSDGSCDPSFAKGLLNMIGAVAPLSLFAGTALQGQAASLPFLFGQQTTDEVMKFFWWQDTAAFTRTPHVPCASPQMDPEKEDDVLLQPSI